jgi:glutathione synthase/RimK-type ligase-like ATP-grasp enzyme
MHIILRRPKLGRTSCKEIAKFMTDTVARRCDWPKFRRLFNNPAPKGYAFRWGCTANLPEGYTVVNTSEAIHQVNEKTSFRKLLQEDKPDIVPQTWFNSNDVPNLDNINGAVWSVIVRPHKHAQGKQLYLCSNVRDLAEAVQRCGVGYYISEYIPKVAEYRVAIVSGRAVWVAHKTPADANAIAWNVARGGRFDNVAWGDWPLKVVKTAIEGFNLSKLDFGGVDVMVDAEGKCYILEINSAPSLTSPYRQECMGKAFQYIIENGKARIPLIEAKGGYRKFIHPAVAADAQLVEV